MPGPDLDIVHAGVVLQLEVHDVVVSGRVAVIIEHHHLGHVAELEVVEVLLQSGGDNLEFLLSILWQFSLIRMCVKVWPSPQQSSASP